VEVRQAASQLAVEEDVQQPGVDVQPPQQLAVVASKAVAAGRVALHWVLLLTPLLPAAAAADHVAAVQAAGCTP
jgi:hypothetical protein